MGRGKKLPSWRAYDPRIAHFEESDNDQNDIEYFRCVEDFCGRGRGFSVYPNSVCFTDVKHKKRWRKYVSEKTNVPISTFKKHTQRKGDCVHVALVEGLMGHVKPKRGARVIPKWGEFHSCLVIVDTKAKKLYVHNPWEQGHLRSRRVKVVNDIRPKLVMRLCKLYNKWTFYHNSGLQVYTSDCRCQVLYFAKRLGSIGREDFATKIPWTYLPQCAYKKATKKQ
jgi:hypothetical protein